MNVNPHKITEEDEKQSFYGWIIVIISFFVMIMGYGGAYSFGVFLKPLREYFGWTQAATSGTFSLFLLSYSSLGIVSGWAVDRFGPRITVGLGGLFIAIGFLLTSRINSLWQIYMIYGLLIGSGMSTAYSPLVTTVSRWFQKKRGLALGIVTAGAGLGNFIIPPMASNLISIYGWRLSYLFLGIAVGGTITFLAFFLKKGSHHKTNLLNKEVLKGDLNFSKRMGFSFRSTLHTKTFWMICLMNMMVGFGLQMILVHIIPHAQESLSVSSIVASTLLSTIGVFSILGRLVMGGASEHIGVKRSLAISTLIEGLMIIGIIISSELWMLYLFASIFGFGYGGHVPQFPGLVGDFFGLERMGTILGSGSIFYGIGGSFGTFLAGFIFDKTGNYKYAFILGALAMFLTSATTFSLKRPKI